MPELNKPTQEQIDEFYNNLNTQLQGNHNFPEDYPFKFIIENDASKLTEIYRVFDDTKNTVRTRESSNGKYLSVTINAFMLDADQVIHKYKETSKIGGVIML